jgi:hypothetical protein
VLVANEGNVVIVNIVGHVSIGKLMSVAAQMQKLPPEFLQQFQGVNVKRHEKSDNKMDDGASTNQPVEAPADKPKDEATK